MKLVKLSGVVDNGGLCPRMRMTQQMAHLPISVCLLRGQNDSHAVQTRHRNNHAHHLTWGEARTATCLKAVFALTCYLGSRYSERKQFCSRWKNWNMGITPRPRDINFGKTQAMGRWQGVSAFWEGSDGAKFFSRPLGMCFSSCLLMSLGRNWL